MASSPNSSASSFFESIAMREDRSCNCASFDSSVGEMTELETHYNETEN